MSYVRRKIMTIFGRKMAGRMRVARAMLPALRGYGNCRWDVIGLRGRTEISSARAAAAQAPARLQGISGAVQRITEGWTVAQPADAKLRGKWWEIFNDPELNALEEQLDINNQNIKQYFENFMEARAIVREARSQYFPTLSAAPAISHSRTSANLGANIANGPLATAKFALFVAARGILGAGPLGQGSQYGARRPNIRRSSQRGRSGERAPHRASQSGGIFFRDSRPGHAAENLQRHGSRGSEAARTDAVAL